MYDEGDGLFEEEGKWSSKEFRTEYMIISLFERTRGVVCGLFRPTRKIHEDAVHIKGAVGDGKK